MKITDEQRKILDAFGLGILQDMANVMTSLEQRGVPEQDVRELVIQFVQEHHEKVKQDQLKVEEELEKQGESYKNKAPKCPKCKSPLMLRDIKAPAGVKNTNNYKSHWYCINDESDCVYERYSKNDMLTELRDYKLVPEEGMAFPPGMPPEQRSASIKKQTEAVARYAVTGQARPKAKGSCHSCG